MSREAEGSDGGDGVAVGEKGVVVGLIEAFGVDLEAGGEYAGSVAVADEAGDLVDGEPVKDAVAEALDDGLGVAGEGVDGGADEPAALVFEGLGEVPVEECGPGGDAAGEEGVDEAVVEVEAGGVEGAGAVGEDAGPGVGTAHHPQEHVGPRPASPGAVHGKVVASESELGVEGESRRDAVPQFG